MPIKGIKGGVGTKALGYGLGAAEEATDPNFNQTVLLLHGDGSEGEGNTSALGDPNFKAFKDNSTSAHAIVVNGDAYGNDFSPYYYADGYWSVLFKEGAGNITIPDSSDFTFGSNNFSIGIWVFRTDDDASNEHGIAHTGGGSYTSWLLTTKKFWGSTNGSSWGIQVNYSSDIALNQWVYLQINRVGNVYTAYHNGSSVGTTTVSGSLYDNSDSFQIGARGGTDEFNGYLSNLIVTNGGNLSGTSVPTAPTTTDSNTKLLCLQSNRFLDNSATGHVLSPTVTDANAPEVSTNTPFTQSKTANVGSGFFDGDTDFLTIAQSADFLFGNNAFSIEFWWYPLDLNTTAFYTLEATGGITFYYSGSAFNLDTRAGSNIISSSNDPILNSWNHIVVTRSGTGTNEGAIFLNGTRVAQGTIATNFTTNAILYIGEIPIAGYDLNGYLSDYRVVNGSNVYNPASSSITVPTTTLTSTGSETKLLTCQYSGAVRNVGFLDDSKYNHQITRNGNVSLGTFSPFSLEDTYWSEFYNTPSDSAGDCNHKILPASFLNDLTIANKASSTKTIEAWVYPTHIRTNANQYYAMAWFCKGNVYFNCGLWSTSSTTTGKFVAYHFDGTQRALASSNDFTMNQWYHLAVVIASETIKIYVDGVLEASGTWYGIGSTGIGEVSVIGGTASNNDWNGYISNLRVSSTVRYPSAFTPSTSPFTSDSDTLLLTNQSNRIVDNSSSANTFTFQNDPKVLPFSPFAPSRSYSKDAVGGSVYCNAASDYLSIEQTSGQDFRLDGDTDWCVEFWLYMINPSANYARVMQLDANSWAIRFDATTSKIGMGTSDAGSTEDIEDPTALSANQWTHFAFTHKNSDSTLRLFRNGVLVASTTSWSPSWSHSTNPLLISRYTSGSASFFGHLYLGSFRIVKADYIYDSAFTPPTAPFTANANTVLLINATNAGIIDHTMKNNLDTVNNVRIRTDIKKFGTGSIYFDGSDSIRWNQNSAQNEGMIIGTGPFTVEFFVYFDGDPNNGGTNGQASLIRDGGGNFVIQRYDGEWEVGSEPTPQIQVATTVANQTWLHVALTRDSSSNLKLFIDGTQTGSTATSFTTDFDQNKWHLGALNADASGGRALTGYMDEIRIIAGVAKYTSNFTAPTEPFANR
tara:strand:- start:44 stop:3472 length:3429 start_codon:yes stop_codon:yes gene_type:complete